MFIYVLFFPLVLKIGIWANGFILFLYLFKLECFERVYIDTSIDF